ncbi:MAG: hypothetical protein JO199_10670 [Candidatus Eremiobacteraeota bacterium]|nr:hypothetical protein [Candidatus Eremiobacteraeota bacterium]
MRVWLPPGYRAARNAARRYPLLVMFDGQNLFDASARDFPPSWHVDDMLADAVRAGTVRPIVVAGIDTPGPRRAEQYIPYPDTHFAPSIVPKGTAMPGFVESEVLPWLRSQFRLGVDRSQLAIGGSSYGAVAALNVLLNKPEIFGLGLLESTALQVGDGQLIADAATLPVAPHRVYVGVGTEETKNPDFSRRYVELSQMLAAAFETRVAHPEDVRFVVQDGAGHNEHAWSQRFLAAVRFLFG